MFNEGDIVRIGPCDEGCEGCLAEVERQSDRGVYLWVQIPNYGPRDYLIPAEALTRVS